MEFVLSQFYLRMKYEPEEGKGGAGERLWIHNFNIHWCSGSWTLIIIQTMNEKDEQQKDKILSTNGAGKLYGKYTHTALKLAERGK